jgi:hypothetical protein
MFSAFLFLTMTRRHIPHLLSCLMGSCALIGTELVQADILYKCQDNTGVVLYTNQKGSAKNCTILSRDLPVTSIAPPPRTTGRAAAFGAPSPIGFPRIDSDTQRSRDSDRRKILEQEYASEQQSLEKAKQALLDGEATRQQAERMQYLRDGVALHERNLDALKRELANLK